MTSLEVCHDGRTLVLGCADGSLQSYVVVDVENDDEWTQVLSQLASRDPKNRTSTNRRPAMSTGPAARVWDKVVRTNTSAALSLYGYTQNQNIG